MTDTELSPVEEAKRRLVAGVVRSNAEIEARRCSVRDSLANRLETVATSHIEYMREMRAERDALREKQPKDEDDECRLEYLEEDDPPETEQETAATVAELHRLAAEVRALKPDHYVLAKLTECLGPHWYRSNELAEDLQHELEIMTIRWDGPDWHGRDGVELVAIVLMKAIESEWRSLFDLMRA
jgi:hypothetical protein